MPSSDHGTKLLLLEDFRPGASVPDIEGLRRQLNALPGFGSVDLSPNGRSTVYATVPGGSPRERDNLKALVDENVQGWRVIEDQGYELPKTF